MLLKTTKTNVLIIVYGFYWQEILKIKLNYNIISPFNLRKKNIYKKFKNRVREKWVSHEFIFCFLVGLRDNN